MEEDAHLFHDRFQILKGLLCRWPIFWLVGSALVNEGLMSRMSCKDEHKRNDWMNTGGHQQPIVFSHDEGLRQVNRELQTCRRAGVPAGRSAWKPSSTLWRWCFSVTSEMPPVKISYKNTPSAQMSIAGEMVPLNIDSGGW